MLLLIDLAHNYVSAEVDTKGFTRFHRFTPEQISLYSNHFVFRLMAQTSAGTYLSFTTTGTEFSFQCQKNSLLKSMMKELGVLKSILILILNFIGKVRKSNSNIGDTMADYFDIIVNGKLISSVKPKNGIIKIPLGNATKEPVQVKVYLPYLQRIKDFLSNGKIIADNTNKELIFCMGDSITQGCFSGKPSLSYVARLGEALHVDALNLGVSGYIYDKASLNGLEALPKPKLITVAYDTNDWSQFREYDTLRNNIRAYYAKLHTLYSDIPIYVITPLWRKDMNISKPCGKFEDVAHLIMEETSPYSNITVIDGLRLVPHDSRYYSDRILHPNDQGFAILAKNLLQILPLQMM